MSIQAIAWAIKQKLGSSSQKLTLIAVANYCDENGRSWPSQKKLSIDTDLSGRTIIRSLDELEQKGVITRTQRARDDGSRSSDIIQINEIWGDTVSGGTDAVSVGVVTGCQGGGDTVSGLYEPLNEPSIRTKNNPRDWPSDFREQFWKAYPKKVEKKAAVRRLEQVRREGEIGFSELLAAVGRIDKSDPKFIKYPARWLQKGCHLDPVSSATNDAALSDQERDQLFAKLREKPNDQSGQRTELREAGVSPREVQGEGREGSTGPPDNRTRNAGMVSLAAVFREPSGLRAGSHEAGSDGNGSADDGPCTMAARF